VNHLRHRRSRAFTLFELLVTLILLGAFSMVASKVFRLTIRTLEGAPAVQDQAVALDGMVETLRRDVWSAAKIERADATSLRLTVGRSEVRWHFEPGSAERTEMQAEMPERHWTTGGPISVAQAGGSTVVIGMGDDRVELPSQLMLLDAGGGKQ
jgi:prepilin-type N-terminal cleavage/methylation domain-containing protein